MEIDNIKRYIRELFPAFGTRQTTEDTHIKMFLIPNVVGKTLQTILLCFQIRKCDDAMCCIPPKVESISWLPDTILDVSGEHFISYKDLNGKVTTEKDRPSSKEKRTN